MGRVRTIPAIVSMKNHFRPADEFVRDALPHLPDQFKHEHFEHWLTRYTETIIKGVASHFGLAAQRGIEQAANLLCDPKFYEARRERQAKERQRFKEDMVKQEWERVERMNCPTEDQIAQQVKSTEQERAYHQSQIDACEVKLHKLRAMDPKSIQILPTKTVQ